MPNSNYEFNPTLRQRMHELGARKEYLSPDEHEELLALGLLPES